MLWLQYFQYFESPVVRYFFVGLLEFSEKHHFLRISSLISQRFKQPPLCILIVRDRNYLHCARLGLLWPPDYFCQDQIKEFNREERTPLVAHVETRVEAQVVHGPLVRNVHLE